MQNYYMKLYQFFKNTNTYCQTILQKGCINSHPTNKKCDCILRFYYYQQIPDLLLENLKIYTIYWNWIS